MKLKKVIASFSLLVILTGCSMFGHSGVEIAPYTVLKSDNAFEVRHYERMVMVTTGMESLDQDSSPFRKLFGYITGDNEVAQDIPMTAPVFMDQEDGKTEAMSFVLPVAMTMEDAPVPSDPDVHLEEIKDYTVAVITFNGFLDQENINHHKDLLMAWIKGNGFQIAGDVKTAGYNPPFTIPALRRNEILIPVAKP